MNDSIDLNDARKTYNLDIGGTPANVLEKGKMGFLLSREIKPEQIVVIVDPFDLSRVERSLVLSDSGNVKRIKFSVEMPLEGEKMSSEYVGAPKREEILKTFQESRGKVLDALYGKHRIFKPDIKKAIAVRYGLMAERIAETAKSSENLREFMNSLIQVLSPVQLNIKKLEEVLSANQAAIYDILNHKEIEARVFCPDCGRMNPYIFSLDRLAERVCCSTAENILQKGSYVPEEGMLPAIVYLSGINPCVSQTSSYGVKALDILKSMGKFTRPFVMYSGNPDKTMFEDFMLRKE